MIDQVLTVTLLTQAIQELLEAEFPVVQVVGEISNYKRHQSGHRYFTLKDEGAQIRCVLWRGRPVPVDLHNGMQVKVRGRLTVYPLQGNYQLDCYSVLPAGLGDLYLAFEQLKRELAALGYFDAARKRQLPRLPRVIGVATSPSGAAIRDILTTLERRNPAVTVIFRPTLVQGAEAAEDIARAIADLENAGCDVIIVGRGGGSIEDLWAFNTRTVAEAIYRCRVPIVSAVGHETDVTIADFVADVRAATPTAAAELCTPIRREDILYWLDEWSEEATAALQHTLDTMEQSVQEFVAARTIRHIVQHVEHLEFYRATLIEGAHRAMLRLWERYNERYTRSNHALCLLHPLRPMQRGFALIERGGIFLSPTQPLQRGDQITLHRLHDTATASVLDIAPHVSLSPTANGEKAAEY